ncbi:MAG: glycoside hydrolase family 43 protein [Bacteroidales bacterium]|nr:glycoside hydrolase family 43 protein [Bacteroidales bacterium]
MYDNGYFYCYSTDAFYGLPVMRAGIQVRRSSNLVHWHFTGWAYTGRPSQAVNYIIQNNGTPVDNVWAPYIIKAGDVYRLYYSQAANEPKLSAIGLITADKLTGPWIQQGLVVTSKNTITMPNAIDPRFNKYYLFISYDWLETKYNVRVSRADDVEGPYYDYNDRDINAFEDNGPMILAPYAFSGHNGWQGTAHCAVFARDDQYYIAHQGRPAINKYFMDLHVRRMLWTEDGWPVVSPERYAGVALTPVSSEEMAGEWEYIEFKYIVVPGFSAEQTDPDIQRAVTLTLHDDSTFNNNSDHQWTFSNQVLEMNWNNVTTDRVIVERGWDWERKKETILFTGLNNNGTTIWGKKK